MINKPLIGLTTADSAIGSSSSIHYWLMSGLLIIMSRQVQRWVRLVVSGLSARLNKTKEGDNE